MYFGYDLVVRCRSFSVVQDALIHLLYGYVVQFFHYGTRSASRHRSFDSKRTQSVPIYNSTFICGKKKFKVHKSMVLVVAKQQLV